MRFISKEMNVGKKKKKKKIKILIYSHLFGIYNLKKLTHKIKINKELKIQALQIPISE